MKKIILIFFEIAICYFLGMILVSIIAPALKITGTIEQFLLTLIFTITFFLIGVFIKDSIT
jgi:hypothetical protein